MMKCKPAFTLLEILIAMVIFGIIALVMVIHSKPVIEKATKRKLSVSAYNYLKSVVGHYISINGKITDVSELCQSITDISNINGVVNCNKEVLNNDFNIATPNFTANNGMVFFNFGSSVQNALYDDEKLVNGYFLIFVDIDGSANKRIYNKDVIGFLINVNGEVLPYGEAATNTDYILAGFKYLDDGNWIWINKKSTFKEAICKSGLTLQTPNYCNGINIDSNCVANICRFTIIN